MFDEAPPPPPGDYSEQPPPGPEKEPSTASTASAPPPPPPAPASSPAPAPLDLLRDPHMRQSAGVTLLWSGVGMAVGAALFGGWGLAAGLTVVGTARNVILAREHWSAHDPKLRAEAARNATLAVFGAGMTALAISQAFRKDKHD